MVRVTALRQAPRRFSRARIRAFRAAERACALLGGRALYRRVWLAPGRLRVRQEVLRVSGLAPALEGFSIVHLSDLHAGPFLGRGGLAHAVDVANTLSPDVVALTGDFVTHHWSEVLEVADDLGRLAPRDALFAVFGNHDYKDRLEARIMAAVPAARFLRNECVRVARGAHGVAFVGVEDLEEGRAVDLAGARRGVLPGDVEIVLAHNPLGARAIARPECAAILSGHTHGTQVDLPFLRRLGPRHPGARVRLGATLLIVSRGLGVVGIPLRAGAPAEIVHVRLERAQAG